MKLTIMARAFNNKIIRKRWLGRQGCNLPTHLQTKKDARRQSHRIAILTAFRRSRSGPTGWWDLAKSLRRLDHLCVSILTSKLNVSWRTSKIGLRCSSRRNKSPETRTTTTLPAIRTLNLIRKRANSRWLDRILMSSNPLRKTSQIKINHRKE